MDVANQNAREAVAYDAAGQADAAIYFYSEAAREIFRLVEHGLAPPQASTIAQKYLDRADVLRNESSRVVSATVKSEQVLNADKANFLLNEALAADEKGNLNEAQQLYAQAVEFCLKCCKSTADDADGQKFRQLALEALERAEFLKQARLGKSGSGIDDLLNGLPTVPTDELSTLNLSNSALLGDSFTNSTLNKLKRTDALEASELKVLATTSKINGKFYVPFMECDLKERFAFMIPFSDKDGLPSLSAKQKARFRAFMRPDEFIETPTVIDCVDSGTIKQTIVSDCSFIASLAISARYERRFGKRLITNIIYPQNRHGVPIYNPCGKYMVRLHVNGIWRKVIIDDRLPVGDSGQLLCSYSQNKSELWVSLLEKAYMKVMGGYDFPGSNSNIDMNALTGWIPERIPIRKNSAEFQPDKVFERLFTRFYRGDCLITLATGQLSESEQKRTGLVDFHAYAVLDLRKINDKRLLLVKNPWTHLRWKGRFSEKDLTSWTPEMCKALDYNPQDAQQFDDGVFWIDYESVCAFFDVIYINWNPELFPFQHALHMSWHAGVGPVKDQYTVGDNPQYLLEVKNTRHKTATIWILLTRHITDKEDFANNKEYITLIVYRSGKRIYIPCNPKPLIDGARINSPHYLCQLMVDEPGLQQYVLVVAQYKKTNTINYTLRIYSSTDFTCHALRSPYRNSKKEAGEWRNKTAGGCGVGDSQHTCMNNPMYHIKLYGDSDENALLIELRGPKEFSVGFDIVQVSAVRDKPFERHDSGAYRPGYTVLQLDTVPAGTYAVRVMTFRPKEEGPFLLRVDATCGFELKRVQ